MLKCQSFHRNTPTTSRPCNDKRISSTNIKMMGTRKQITTIPSSIKLYPCLTNGFSHHYYLEESTFIFRGVRHDFYFFISFFDEISMCKQNIAPQMGRRVLRRHIWGCANTIKRFGHKCPKTVIHNSIEFTSHFCRLHYPKT